MAAVFVGPTQDQFFPLNSAEGPLGVITRQQWGLTVWRDSGGAWHQAFGPSPTDLAGATAVYGGGRRYVLTSAQQDDLVAAGYGAYITQETA